VEGFPTHFNDSRLLREVINPEFAFFTYGMSPRLHPHHGCRPNARTTTTIKRRLEDVKLARLCPRDRDAARSLLSNWRRSVELSGPAVYSIRCMRSHLTETDQPRSLESQLLERIFAHYQVMALPLEAPQENHSWVVAIIPAQLAEWVDQQFDDGTPTDPANSYVHPNDTPAMLECAISLKDRSPDNPLGSFATAIETARTICS